MNNYPCPVIDSICQHFSAKDRAEVERDLALIIKKLTNQELSTSLVFDGRSKPKETCLTAWLMRSAKLAIRLDPYLKPGSRALEFGGGIGRLGFHLRPKCSELVSVDVDPLMKEYGPALSPDIVFKLPDEVETSEKFDFIYSASVFFLLKFKQQQDALVYMRERIKPGGVCIVDLLLGDFATRLANGLRVSDRTEFMEFVSGLFHVREEAKLFNNTLILSFPDWMDEECQTE
jgi:hypothetical protein